jgi:hypothetical protein
VEVSLLVHVEQRLRQLLRDVSDLVLLQLLPLFLSIRHQLIEILLDIFEHKVGLVDYADDFLQFYYIRMVHLPQSLYL